MRKQIKANPFILVILSDVNSSPQLIAILKEIRRRGADIRVILIGSKESRILSEIELMGIKVTNMRSREKFRSAPLFVSIFWYILSLRPLTVFASGQFATTIGMFCSKLLHVDRRIFIRHYSNFHIKYNMKLGKLLDRASNFLATDIVAVSLLTQKVLTVDEGADPRKIHIIYNGIDLEQFQQPATSDIDSPVESSNKQKVFRIGVISRLIELKGVEYIAQAFVRLHKEFPHTQIHIIGVFSDSHASVLKILSSTDDSAYVLEESNNSIHNFLWGLDVFVHTPTGPEDESFGLVYIEALAAKVPCIFTVSGILNEFPGVSSYATIVPYRQSDEIYNALSAQIKGTSVTRSNVPEALLDQFSLTLMASKYSDLILG